MNQKEVWNAAFEKYLRQLDGTKPVIWTGDVNVVPTQNGARPSDRISLR
jgi:AP endonuclease-1